MGRTDLMYHKMNGPGHNENEIAIKNFKKCTDVTLTTNKKYKLLCPRGTNLRAGRGQHQD